MSLIPQRKKTPEELAALRAQELSSHPAYQAAAPPNNPATPSAGFATTPSVTASTPAVTASTPAEKMQHVAETFPVPAVQASSPQQEATVRLRKKPPMKHGHVQAFDGLRPAAATEIPVGSPGEHAALPQRKHDGRELQELRHRGMMQTRPPVHRIMAMQLHPVMSCMLYVIALAVIINTIRFWSHEGMLRYVSPAIGCGSLLLISLFLYFKKPRARHHAAILSGICLVVIGFVILLTLKNPYAP
jgi:hypothetical protein